MSSFAQSDHHALTVNTEAGYFAIPYEIWRWEDDPDVFTDDTVIEDAEELSDPSDDGDGPGEYHESGMLVFSAKDNIDNVDQHKLEAEQIYRGVYIGDWIYALDSDGNVQSFKPSF